jgi:hypothetical protein
MNQDDARRRLDAAIDGFAEHLERVRAAQEQRARLVVEEHSVRRRITVRVNADGALVDLRFSRDVAELGYDEIAKTVLSLARRAAATAARQAHDLVAPALERPAGVPSVAELADRVPDLRDRLPRS